MFSLFNRFGVLTHQPSLDLDKVIHDAVSQHLGGLPDTTPIVELRALNQELQATISVTFAEAAIRRQMELRRRPPA